MFGLVCFSDPCYWYPQKTGTPLHCESSEIKETTKNTTQRLPNSQEGGAGDSFEKASAGENLVGKKLGRITPVTLNNHPKFH